MPPKETASARGYTLRPGFADIVLCRFGRPYKGKLPVRHSFHLVSVALTVAAKQTFGKAVLLLLVEARVQRLGSVGELLSVVGTLDLGIGILSHFIERIEGAMLLSACVSHCNPDRKSTRLN